MRRIVLVLIGVFWLSMAAWAADQEVVDVSVTGLACPFCAYSVEKSLGKLSGVDKVTVDLAASRVRVVMKAEHSADLQQIKAAIVNAGFTPGEALRSTAQE
jgi:copper chaperone CopZ